MKRKESAEKPQRRPHLGHHIIATIELNKLLLGWDNYRQVALWSEDAPEKIRDAVIDYVDTA